MQHSLGPAGCGWSVSTQLSFQMMKLAEVFERLHLVPTFEDYVVWFVIIQLIIVGTEKVYVVCSYCRPSVLD